MWHVGGCLVGFLPVILEFWARPNPIRRKWSLSPLPEKLKLKRGWIVQSEMVMKKLQSFELGISKHSTPV